MSNDIVISVENLSKRYCLGQISATSLRESAEHWWHKVRGRDPRDHMGEVGEKTSQEETKEAKGDTQVSDYMWALKDVSFEVKRGEVLGIIGKNGAGKSTLLKILSRITEPTSGRAVLHGRVGSLLEVGTGFHPELTGRENIFLNGAILGMKKREVAAKFDEIVAFAEIDKFIDTPVKRYSSGMYVRLAFAVAAHLDPEILVIDEVLAVGDAGFQKKCMGKMGDIASHGRTVLFVSHNMEAIKRLCPRALWLQDGQLESQDYAQNVIASYLSLGLGEKQFSRSYSFQERPGNDYVRLVSVRISVRGCSEKSHFAIDDALLIEIEYDILRKISNYLNYIEVSTIDGVLAFGSCDWDGHESEPVDYLPGRYCASCVIPKNLLNRGNYSLAVMGTIPMVEYLFQVKDVLRFDVHNMGGVGGATASGRPGVFRPFLDWDITSVSTSGT